MKIPPKASQSFLAKPDAQHRVCLLYGPDMGLSRERSGQIKKTILAGNNDPFAYIEMEETALLDDPAKLIDELSAISLMGGKRLILIRGASDKATKIIESAEEHFHHDVFLVLLAGELTTRSSLRKWAEKQNDVASVAAYKDEMRNVQELIRQTFADEQITADRDCVEYLAQHLGNDRYVTRQELEKLVTYAGDRKTLSLDDVQKLVDYNRDTQLDDVVAAVAGRNLREMEKTLANVLREGLSPVAYIRALQRYFNRLYKMRSEIDQGQSVDVVVKGARPPIFFKQVPQMTRHLNQWSLPALTRALKLLVEAELACKTSDIPIVPASTRKLMQVTQQR